MPKHPASWQTLAYKNKHDRDACIEFDEPTHKYTVNNSSEGWTSCTGFLHIFFPHFDANATIQKMMKSKNWPQSKYYGMTANQIKAQWSASGKEASEAGTAMHLGIEQYHNGTTPDASIQSSIEWKYFQNFWKDHGTTLEPYRTEWEVWSEEHKLAGSIDMIYRKKTDGTFVIYDWKRSKDIKMTNDWENGYNPVNHLPNSNYWHYTLQLNVYKWFLETFYGLVISDLYLVILHPDNTNYHRMRLNILKEEVQDMLDCRLRAIREKSKAIVVLPTPPNSEEEEESTNVVSSFAIVDDI